MPHLELSTIIGTRAMSGSAPTKIKECDHLLLGIEQAFIHIDVDNLSAALDLLAGNA